MRSCHTVSVFKKKNVVFDVEQAILIKKVDLRVLVVKH